MEFHAARKIMFKAWNKETKLLMRLNSIECQRGELVKKNHILLQFTGMYDQNEEEIYDMDVLMIGTDRYIVFWDAERSGWMMSPVSSKNLAKPISKDLLSRARRLWSYFEAEQKPTG